MSIETELDAVELAGVGAWETLNCVQLGENLLLIESDQWVEIDYDAERVPMKVIVKHPYHRMVNMLIGLCFRHVHQH